jgi:long-chain acyl-CoA synthetase
MSVRTLVELYQHGITRFPKHNAFMRKMGGSYEAVSSEDFSRDVRRAAYGLMALGVRPGDRVGLLSENRVEWAVADLAVLTCGAINVPVYPTLTSPQIEYILQDAGARLVFVSTREQIEKMRGIRGRLSNLEKVVAFDDSGGRDPWCGSMEELFAGGDDLAEREPRLYSERMERVGAEDLASIIYTSGTTGPPKGVMLTHANIVSNVASALELLDLGPEDLCLSFLPLSHILERMAGYYTMLYRGVTIAYAESVDTVADNLVETRPTVMISVPRLYEKMYGRVLDTATAGPPLKKRIFFWARGVGLKVARRRIAGKRTGPLLDFQYRIADHLVFSRLRERTGGRLRFFVSGGAPLAQDIAEFFYAAGLVILEGYGLTETSPVIAVNTFDRYRPGTVGRPVPNVEVRIAEDGEILVRGPNVMKGYYGREEESRAALEGGWFHTGDIGELDADGFLRITDRKKDLIVTSGGKNVAPQHLEALLKRSKYVTEAVVLGDRRKFISALIVPNFENLERYAHARDILYTDLTGLVRNERIRSLFEREILRFTGDLASYEQVKKFRVIDQDFTLETGELTPTMKVRRTIISEKYADLVEEMYAENG